MPLEERVKDALTMASRSVDPDVRRELTTVRRRARRSAILRRSANLAFAATLVAAAVVVIPRVIDADRGPRDTLSADALGNSASGDEQLAGSWTQAQSCQDFVRALTRYGLPRYVPRFLVGNRYREGPSSVVAADPHPCAAAGPTVRRTWTFDGTRLLGFRDGKQVDLAIPEFIDEHTMRLGHINFRFHIEGDALHFIVPALPRSCRGPDCVVQHAWAVAAFGLGPWTRTTER
jgi:hypothetical protein